MGIVNANYEFIYVNSGVNGRMSDGGVIATTSFHKKLKTRTLHLPPKEENIANLNFVFVSDEAFSLDEHLLKPYSAKELNHDRKIFNYRLSRARCIVENVFGILGARFRIFNTEINLSLEKIDYVILASCMLHNYLRKTAMQHYSPNEMFDRENLDSGERIVGNWRDASTLTADIQQGQARNYSAAAKLVRDEYMEYFNTVLLHFY